MQDCARVLCRNMGRISVGHVGRVQPQGRSRAGPEEKAYHWWRPESCSEAQGRGGIGWRKTATRVKRIEQCR